MRDYQVAYEASGHRLPAQHEALAHWFDAMQAGEQLPPRAVQAVQAGLVAHALTDPKVDPEPYRYYQWVSAYLRSEGYQWQELSAQLIGMAFVSCNVFKTELPQPLTLNPWQAAAMAGWPLRNSRAVIVENNGVFIWLHHLHPDWPLINQGGNDFQESYVTLLAALVDRGLRVTYLGDLDAVGIRMADTLRQALPETSEFLALQTPTRVLRWLSVVGRRDPRRVKQQRVRDADLQLEMASVVTQGRFVEQEQLLAEYEPLITQWLVDGSVDDN